MGRRIASQVHHQVSRLMRGNLIRQEPKWYQPVLNFPPLPLPPKAPPERTTYDLKMSPVGQKLRRPKNRPLPIHYLEDDIRRQFYADHPFEAFRPTTLVEKGDIELREVGGEGWTRLRQRGRNPTAEDAIQFALNLHETHNKPLSEAYAQAIAQFRALRSEHHIATSFAAMEAEELGGAFVRGEIEHAFEKEKRALATWERLDDIDEGALTARKRWKMIAERHAGESEWSRGVQYVRMWQAGNRVDYSPAMTSPIDDDAAAMENEKEEEDEDLKIESEESEDERAGGADVASNVLTLEELDALVAESLGLEAEVSVKDPVQALADAESHPLEDSVAEDPPPPPESEGSEFFNFTKKS